MHADLQDLANDYLGRPKTSRALRARRVIPKQNPSKNPVRYACGECFQQSKNPKKKPARYAREPHVPGQPLPRPAEGYGTSSADRLPWYLFSTDARCFGNTALEPTVKRL